MAHIGRCFRAEPSFGSIESSISEGGVVMIVLRTPKTRIFSTLPKIAIPAEPAQVSPRVCQDILGCANLNPLREVQTSSFELRGPPYKPLQMNGKEQSLSTCCNSTLPNITVEPSQTTSAIPSPRSSSTSSPAETKRFSGRGAP